MATSDIKIFDADNHLYETEDAFTKFLPDRYRGAIEELTPVQADPRCAIPLCAVAIRLLLSPSASARMTGDTVRSYSLTSETIRRLQEWNAEDPHRAGSSSATSIDPPSH